MTTFEKFKETDYFKRKLSTLWEENPYGVWRVEEPDRTVDYSGARTMGYYEGYFREVIEKAANHESFWGFGSEHGSISRIKLMRPDGVEVSPDRVVPVTHKSEFEIGVLVTTRLNEKGLELRVKDDTSRAEFLNVTLSPQEALQALGGLACVEAKAKVKDLDHLGKKQITDTIEFPYNCTISNQEGDAARAVTRLLEGSEWKPDLSFSSRDSFFWKEDEEGNQQAWARTIIRKWVDRDDV